MSRTPHEGGENGLANVDHHNNITTAFVNTYDQIVAVEGVFASQIREVRTLHCRMALGSHKMSRPANDERFAKLLRAHHTQLFGYLYGLVHNFSDAEDLYQETSMVLWRKFEEYREGTSFFNWALTTARYKMLNFLRTRRRRSQFSAELREKLSEDFDELDAGVLGARLEALQDCKQRLSEDDRRLLDVCYGSELSFRETADVLGRSPKSVYDALRRIRRVLMDCIQDRLTKQERDS
jgi:RNA polymerase sigma-70 factor, ECF subfamily